MIDIHNHLADARLRPLRERIFADLSQSGRHLGGLEAAVVNSAEESDWEPVAELAREHSWVIPAFGLHPWYVHRAGENWLQRLEGFLDDKAILGEIGLDRWIPDHDLPLQKEAFSLQLALAAERNLPVTIHCLKAWGVLLEMLQSQPLPDTGFLLHSYSGPLEMVGEFAKLGARFSFSPSFLHERKSRQREVFAQIPLERLLVETDAPDMGPPPERNPHPLLDAATGEMLNHPANLEVAYAGLAEIRQMPVAELAAVVAVNARVFLGPRLPRAPFT